MTSVDEANRDVLDSSAAGGMLLRGGVLRFGAYFVAVALSVIAAALLTRHLGAGRFGQYTTVMSLVAVVAAISDAGMASIGTREYAVLRGEERDLLMRDLLGLRIVLTLTGTALIFIFAVAAGYDTPLVVGALAAALATVALVFQHTLSIPLTTDLRLGLLSALELVRQGLWVAGVVVLVAVGASVLPLLAIPLAVNLLLIAPTARLVRGRISPRPALRPAAWRPLLGATVVFSLATAVGTIYVYTAQIITGLVTTPHQSGIFAVSFRVFIVSASVPGLLVAAALPILARAARDDFDRLAYALQRIFEVSLVAGVGAALVMSTGAHFIVSVIAGPKYRAAAPSITIQSFAMIGSFIVAGWSFGLVSLRLHRGLLACNAVALLVSVVLTLGLANSDGAQGAAIATVCAETILAAGALIALVWGRPRYRPELGVALKVAVAAACAAVASLVPTLPSLVRALVAAVVYAAIILVLRALPAELMELVRRPSA